MPSYHCKLNFKTFNQKPLVNIIYMQDKIFPRLRSCCMVACAAFSTSTPFSFSRLRETGRSGSDSSRLLFGSGGQTGEFNRGVDGCCGGRKGRESSDESGGESGVETGGKGLLNCCVKERRSASETSAVYLPTSETVK